MLVSAFQFVDGYTLMSLFDVILHACLQFKEDAYELAANVTPLLVKCFNITNEQQIHSIVSLLGK
jgi:hypothetical protein